MRRDDFSLLSIIIFVGRESLAFLFEKISRNVMFLLGEGELNNFV